LQEKPYANGIKVTGSCAGITLQYKIRLTQNVCRKKTFSANEPYWRLLNNAIQ